MSADRSEGLRERKKRRTRQAIIEVAHELFHDRGFEATTVEEIAAGAEVSVRTLFRYFTGKEAIALAPLEEMGDLTVAALRRRPADEPPLVALRSAALSAWSLMSPDGASLRHYADHLLPLGGASPLTGAVLSRLVSIGDRLAAELVNTLDGDGDGDGDGGDGDAEPDAGTEDGDAGGGGSRRSEAEETPTREQNAVGELDAQLTVVTFLGAIQVAIRAWCGSGSTNLDDLLVTVESCLERISPKS